MANVYAVKSGNWSDTTVWNTGALPTSADDVYSNNFTVTVDTSPTVLSVRNGSAAGINAGGGFTLTNGITLTATVQFVAGVGGPGAYLFNTSVASASISAPQFIVTANSASGLLYTGTGTLTISASCSGGGAGGTSQCIINSSTGTINIIGNVSGGSQVNSEGAVNLSSGTINITATSVTSLGTGTAVINSGSGTINITVSGSVTSNGTGTAAINSGSGTINITGTCTGGSSTGNAFTNSSTGTINHIGTAQASTTAPAIGQGSAGQVTILTGPLLSTDASFAGGATPSGVNPCIALRWFPKNTALSTFRYTMRAQNVVGIRSERSFYHSDAYTSSYPIVSNVRRNINYGPVGIYTGTMDIPNPQSVGLGVGVGTVTGTAVFSLDSFWNASISGISYSGSIGERIKTIATVATVSQQISDAFSAR